MKDVRFDAAEAREEFMAAFMLEKSVLVDSAKDLCLEC